MFKILNNGSWKRVKGVHHFNNGHWHSIKNMSLYNDSRWIEVFSYNFNITIDSQKVDFKLKDALQEQGWTEGPVLATVIINSPLSASSTQAFAFDTSGVPNSSIVTIINNSTIIGAGGKGGNCGYKKVRSTGGELFNPQNIGYVMPDKTYYAGESGGDGGHAINLTIDKVYLNNLNGLIAGGGGGGGASIFGDTWLGGCAGGGGAGMTPGGGGVFNSAAGFVGENGTAGSENSGGKGGALCAPITPNNIPAIALGGHGGSLGEDGASSYNTHCLNFHALVADGGKAGAAILGFNKIISAIGLNQSNCRGRLVS